MRKISHLRSQPHLHLERVSLPLRWDDPGKDCRWPEPDLGLSLTLAIEHLSKLQSGGASGAQWERG